MPHNLLTECWSTGVLEYWNIGLAIRGGVYPLQKFSQRPIVLRFPGSMAISRSQGAFEGGDKPSHYKNWKFLLLGSHLSANPDREYLIPINLSIRRSRIVFFTTPLFHYSITPLLHYSNIPVLQYSSTPVLQYSIIPLGLWVFVSLSVYPSKIADSGMIKDAAVADFFLAHGHFKHALADVGRFDG